MNPPAETPFDPPPAPAPHRDHIARGIALALAAYFLFAVMQACAKILAERHHVAEILFYRNLIALIPIVIYIIAFKKWNILKTGKPVAMVFRALIGSVSLLLTFATFQHLPMADATVILFAGIILTPAIAFFALKEHVGLHRWGAIILGLFGVILMMRPSSDMVLTGVVFAFSAAFLHAFVNVTLRYLKSESPLTIVFYFVFSGTVVPALFMPFIALTPEKGEWLLLLGVGISGLAAQTMLTLAFRMAPASLIAIFNYTGLLWATGMDIMIWNYMPGMNVFAGGAIILAANLYIIHRERLAAKRKR